MALSIVSCSLDANGWNAYEEGKEFITIKGSNLEFIKAILSDLVNNKEDEKIPSQIQKGKKYLCISFLGMLTFLMKVDMSIML